LRVKLVKGVCLQYICQYNYKLWFISEKVVRILEIQELKGYVKVEVKAEVEKNLTLN
jgi:hypothetical protein